MPRVESIFTNNYAAIGLIVGACSFACNTPPPHYLSGTEQGKLREAERELPACDKFLRRLNC